MPDANAPGPLTDEEVRSIEALLREQTHAPPWLVRALRLVLKHRALLPSPEPRTHSVRYFYPH